MNTFVLNDPLPVPSPSLLFGWAGIQSNLQRMIAIAGSPARLRPHMKTHKTKEITQLYLQAGIAKHKCATLREAEVLAECGAADVLIAYPMVGPNQQRLCALAQRFPKTRFSCLGDDDEVLSQLNQAATQANVKLGFFLDYNVGQNRTGMQDLPAWMAKVIQWTHLRLCGMHLYDGHNNPLAQEERRSLSQRTYQRAVQLGLDQPGQSLEFVLGGTPAFLLLADMIKHPQVSFSPGTCILHDAGYGPKYPELGFTPAAAVLTRCISRPGLKLVTFDIGTKAICADPPFGQRVHLVGLENAVCTLHNEEHYVVETGDAEKWKPGMTTYAIPKHICPTVAMYDKAYVVEEGRVTKEIAIAARGR